MRDKIHSSHHFIPLAISAGELGSQQGWVSRAMAPKC